MTTKITAAARIARLERREEQRRADRYAVEEAHRLARADDVDHDEDPIEREDYRTYRDQVMCDRLDMGRNEAGEWLGFM